MRLLLRKPLQSLNKAYARQAVPQSRMDSFRRALSHLFTEVNEQESEADQPINIRAFLEEAFYGESFTVDTQQPIDLVISTQQAGNRNAIGTVAGQAVSGVAIETRKAFASEMMTPLKNNVKALHELILYYFDQRERQPETTIHHLVVTDIYNWFIFDERDFATFFYENRKLKKLYQLRQQKKDDAVFYAEAARILRELDADIPVTYLNLRETSDALSLPLEQGNRVLLPVLKLLSPQHLLAVLPENTADSLNQPFYNELLYILGFSELSNNESGRYGFERRPEADRQAGSLLESTLRQLQANESRTDLAIPEQQIAGNNQAVAVASELCFTWLSRILFLKLLESQLVHYHQGDQRFAFLSVRHIRDFADLDELFFEVMSIPENQRSASVITRYHSLPYLNSELFEMTMLEQQTIRPKNLDRSLSLPLFEQTVLTEVNGQLPKGQLPALQYLLAFLDAFDFTIDQVAGIQSDAKWPISAHMVSAVLGRLNGGETVPTATNAISYLIRNVVRKTVLSKLLLSLSEPNGLPRHSLKTINGSQVTKESERIDADELPEAGLDSSINELRDYFSRFYEPSDLRNFNGLINSIKILDPAVGNGDFLVTALCELIVIKAELGILIDQDGRRLPAYTVSIINGELLITDEDGEPFVYTANAGADQQRVQETIFREKRAIIENCLFGTDTHVGAVSVSRWRLWVELLKNAYYQEKKAASPQQSLLPNLGQTIVAGNALVSRIKPTLRLDTLKKAVREKRLTDFQHYKRDQIAYRTSQNTAEKQLVRQRLQAFLKSLDGLDVANQKRAASIRQLEAELTQLVLTFDYAENTHFQRIKEQLVHEKEALAISQQFFQSAIEWRFLFAEALDESGDFVGFDLVIGQPPVDNNQLATGYKTYFQKAFPNTYTSKAPGYALFIELGLALLKPTGSMAFMLPKKWMQAGPASKLRKWLKTKSLEQIIDLSHLQAAGENAPKQSVLVVDKVEPTETLACQITEVQTLTNTVAGLKVSGKTMRVSLDSLPDRAWKFEL